MHLSLHLTLSSLLLLFSQYLTDLSQLDLQFFSLERHIFSLLKLPIRLFCTQWVLFFIQICQIVLIYLNLLIKLHKSVTAFQKFRQQQGSQISIIVELMVVEDFVLNEFNACLLLLHFFFLVKFQIFVEVCPLTKIYDDSIINFCFDLFHAFLIGHLLILNPARCIWDGSSQQALKDDEYVFDHQNGKDEISPGTLTIIIKKAELLRCEND